MLFLGAVPTVSSIIYFIYDSINCSTTTAGGGRGGGDPAMDYNPIQGGIAILIILLGMLHAKETRIRSGHLGLWLVCTFTLPFYLWL